MRIVYLTRLAPSITVSESQVSNAERAVIAPANDSASYARLGRIGMTFVATRFSALSAEATTIRSRRCCRTVGKNSQGKGKRGARPPRL
jgi:hypothetical protein